MESLTHQKCIICDSVRMDNSLYDFHPTHFFYCVQLPKKKNPDMSVSYIPLRLPIYKFIMDSAISKIHILCEE